MGEWRFSALLARIRCDLKIRSVRPEKRGLVTCKGSGLVRVETVVDARRNIVQV